MFHGLEHTIYKRIHEIGLKEEDEGQSQTWTKIAIGQECEKDRRARRMETLSVEHLIPYRRPSVFCCTLLQTNAIEAKSIVNIYAVSIRYYISIAQARSQSCRGTKHIYIYTLWKRLVTLDSANCELCAMCDVRSTLEKSGVYKMVRV